MQTKTIYEETILKEVQGLSQPVQKKLAKVVHFFKQEIITSGLDERCATDDFLSVCGTWEYLSVINIIFFSFRLSL